MFYLAANVSAPLLDFVKLRTDNNSAKRAQKTFPEKALYSLERNFSYVSQLALNGPKAETPGLMTFFSCFNLEIIHPYQTAFRDKKFVASLLTTGTRGL